ncbi:UPF0565 C2orf69-like protein isoform B [Micractinium conductrix]|uniref:UPF0565 C2orf69-like protein isoform B n=1 Tax=Micractinium conductrix TaxID=554055 RepID=A0A2P6V869_9CHLO|nr:UPF0565 C2orf69-like protein isoform B [Micractinium conductrix]|eukprot:PSC70278.1 UPF0565 C2orf69-like protein isoform B [Micractinium conductrix]
MAAALSRLGWASLAAPPEAAGTTAAATAAAATPAAAQAAVVYLSGDRVPPAALGERAAQLQQPAVVADTLAAKFPGVAVLVVLPQRYRSDAACYDSFLPGPLDAQGLPPAFTAAGFPAARALAAVLAAGGLPAPGRPLPPLALLGFSKAGVVLHQVVVELAAWQRQQLEEAPRCCGHCLHDLPCALTYALCDTTRRNQVNEPYQPWWPASIKSPTLYFRLKRRAMEHQCREQSRAGFSDSATWRAQHRSAAGGVGSLLRARRGLRQLGVHIPAARTNVSAGDGLEYVGTLSLEAPSAPVQQHPEPMQQQQQQQQVAAPAVLRPRTRRPVPLPHAPAPQPAAQPQPHLSLLASLQYHEQCHWQQLAAAAAPLPSCWGGFPSAAEAHPGALLRPKWQAGWGGDPQQQQQQQAFHHHQQAAAAAAAAASAASAAVWPFSVQRPQEGWAFACQLAAAPPLLQPCGLSARAAC